MEHIADDLTRAYEELVASVAGVLEGNDGGLEKFKQRWQLFRAACDGAEEYVESAKQRIGSECLVDEATGSMATATATGIPPISAVRLEQMSKAVRWLVLELQQNASSSSTPPFDARFSEDVAQ